MALSTRDYNKYLKYASADFTPPSAENLEVARFIFADNLVGRSQKVWSLQALDSIRLRTEGMPFTYDHNWDKVAEARAVIFDTKRFSFDSAPDKFVNNYARALNKKIIKRDGWQGVVGKVAIPSKSTLIEKLALGAGNKVSIGGFRETDIICPLCNVSFYKRDICKHVPPSPYYEDSENTAPYTIRADVVDMGEVSLVLIPNAPSAGAITNDIAEYFKDYA